MDLIGVMIYVYIVNRTVLAGGWFACRSVLTLSFPLTRLLGDWSTLMTTKSTAKANKEQDDLIQRKAKMSPAFAAEIDRVLTIIFSGDPTEERRDERTRNHRCFRYFGRLCYAYNLKFPPSEDWLEGYFEAVLADDDPHVEAIFRLVRDYLTIEDRTLDWVQRELTSLMGELAREGRKVKIAKTSKNKTP